MSLRIIMGSSGQGKTTHILEEVIRLSRENKNQMYYIIVPEQFSLEMQKKLVESHPDRGYVNIDVLSFYRLAYRVFDELRFWPKDILEDLGVSLILKKILAEHEEEFPFFKKTLRKSGFVDELKSMLMEFIGYGITREQVQDLDDGRLADYPGLEHKCRELGKIYEYFEEEISGRFMVAEQILDVLCEMVSDSRLLREGIFYLDGFTGFTPVQKKFIKELLKNSKDVHVSLTMEDASEEEIFSFSARTLQSLAELCRESGVKMEEPLVLKQENPPRFHHRELIHLEKNLFRSGWEKDENPVEHIHLTSCKNPEAEAEYILHKIEAMVRTKAYRYRDFAVLTGNVEEYQSIFQRKADILHIPLFTDTKRRVSYHSGVETLRSLFHLAVMDYSYESVFRYLKSGMSAFTDEETDILENYVLWSGVRGYGMWKKPFVRRMTQLGEQGETIQRLRQKLLEETQESVLALRDRHKTVREKMTTVYETLCHLHYDRKLDEAGDQAEARGDYVREKEYRQLFTLILELMDKIVGIFGEEYLPAEELEEMMDAGLDALELGTPPLSMDQVLLGDLKRTRLPDVQVLFLVGVNEGKIPPALEDRGILNDEEKQILDKLGMTLSLPLAEQSLEDEFYLYLALTKPAQELYFTYARQDSDGGTLWPSSLLKTCMELFPALPEKTYPEEEMRYYFNEEDSRDLLLCGLQKCREGEPPSRALSLLVNYWYEKEDLRPKLEELWEQTRARTRQEPLSQEIVQALFGRELVGSVTRLERFAACPYQYYCIYGLGLEERPEYKVRAVDLGNLFHQALEGFSTRVKQSEYSWKTIPEELAETWIDEAVEKAAGNEVKEVLDGTARNQYKYQVVCRILRRTVKILKLHLKNSQMEPDRFELHFGRTDQMESIRLPLKNGNRMRLEGFIDRVDVCEEEDRVLLRIIDYKSGNQTFDLNELYHGLQMQLVVYMNVATEIYQKETGKPVVPAGMFYYGIKDPIVRADAFTEDTMLTAYRMSGYANSAPDVLEKLENLEEGTDRFISASVRMTKNGTPYKNAPVMDTEDFQRIGRYTRRKIMEMGEAVYAGKLNAHPYKNEKKTSCDYCPFQSVCGFDASLEDGAYRQMNKESAQNILEEIRKQVD